MRITVNVTARCYTVRKDWERMNVWQTNFCLLVKTVPVFAYMMEHGAVMRNKFGNSLEKINIASQMRVLR